ncbi:N-acetylmuramoyl-L-alanine amidase [Halobacillus karajensis]|uniref:N-acetylmuramoyl-L-alanine amidase n=1 Tax=Halobacillus karajensis TaxID=195088 RepID=UPI0008A7C6FC|nr:N-acetylmuramoyl-L-alanine amidase [Halobacillus karajensis]SEI04467.1 N-acetylmuramoyl-L-alanine amidase [Halobacillus karajensis]
MFLENNRVGSRWFIPFFVLFLATCTFFSTSIHVSAQQEESYRVGVHSLNIRSGPDFQSPITGSLSENTVVKVNEIRYGWAHVNHAGKEGWVASQYLYKTQGIQTSSPEEVMVDVESAYIRSGPSENHDIIGSSFSGDSLEKIAEEGEWFKVRWNGEKVGWIAGWLVANSFTPPSSNLPLKGVNVVLDAGHGGYDPGAIGLNGLFEKHPTLKTTKRIAQELRQAGATVIMTRERDRYLSLQDRVQITRSYHTDAFISIHFNSADTPYAEGMSSFYYHDSGKELATNIQHQLSQKVPLENDGVQFGNFHVLRENIGHSVLLELGFLSTSSDLRAIQSNDYTNRVAKAISSGVINQFSN